MNPIAKAKQIKISFMPTFKSEFYELDLLRFKQIIVNLIKNAIQFSRTQTSIRIHLKTAKMGRAATNVRIEITDRGIGISK